MRTTIALTSALLAAALTVSTAEAASCSHWKKMCDSRAGGSACDAKFAKCMKDGSWQEGEKWGGKTHTGLARR